MENTFTIQPKTPYIIHFNFKRHDKESNETL